MVFIKNYINKIRKSDIAIRMSSGVFWSLFGAILARGLNLIAFIIVARILGEIKFGQIGIIQSTISMFQIFASFGMGITATKYIAEYRNSDLEKTRKIILLSGYVSLSMGVIFALLIYIFANKLAITMSEPSLAVLIKISALILFLDSINGVQLGILSGYERFQQIAKANIYSGMLYLPAIIFFLLWGDVKGVIWSLVLLSMLRNIFFHWYVRGILNQLRVNFLNFTRDIFTEINVLFSFSLPTIMSNVLISPITWICNAILVAQPFGYAEMGVFNAANQWKVLVMYLPGFVGRVSFPILSQLYGKNLTKQFRKLLRINLYFMALISFSIALLIAAFSKFIFGFYGEAFVNKNIVLIIMVFVGALIAINTMIGQAINSEGKAWLNLFLNIIWGTILLVMTCYLKNRGALGLAYANITASTVHFVFSYFLISKHVR